MTVPVPFLVPEMVDDPLRVSGGNVYDARIADVLRRTGKPVRLVRVGQGTGTLAAELARMPADAVALVDGLLVAGEPLAFVRESHRLRLVVLAHMAASREREDEILALRCAARIVTTSEWTRAQLVASGAAAPERVVVAHPGTERGVVASPSAAGGRLLCAGVLAPHKGQEQLVAALAALADVDGWRCTVAGSVTADPGHVRALVRMIDDAGLSGRIRLTGVLSRAELDAEYTRADLLVHPSLGESYGMVVAEALSHGVPVLATRVGGLPEAVSRPDAARLIPAADGAALRDALRAWLQDPALRARMREAAVGARADSRGWSSTASVIAAALQQLAEDAELVEARSAT